MTIIVLILVCTNQCSFGMLNAGGKCFISDIAMSSTMNDNLGWSRQQNQQNTGNRINLVRSDLGKLKLFQESLTEQENARFRQVFGSFERIMSVSTNIEAILALVRFYDPQGRVFRLNDLDIIPTLDEYHCLFSPTCNTKEAKIYTNAFSHKLENVARDLEMHCGIKHTWNK